jgi:hypothetical protein
VAATQPAGAGPARGGRVWKRRRRRARVLIRGTAGSRPRTAWEAGRRPAAIPVAAVAVAGTGNGTPATVRNPSRPLSPPPPQEPPQPRCALNLLGGLMKEGGRNISYRLVYSRLDPSKSQLAAVAFRPPTRQTHDDSLEGSISGAGPRPAPAATPRSRDPFFFLFFFHPPARLLPSACSVVGG